MKRHPPVWERHPARIKIQIMSKKIFISADHGMAIIYFLQSDVVPTLLEAGVEIVILTDDETREKIAQRFARPGLTFEGLKLKEANAYATKFKPRLQWLLIYLRRVGGSWRINNEAMDSHIWEVWVENGWKFRVGIWIPAALGDPRFTDVCLRAEFFGTLPDPLHSPAESLCRFIRGAPTRSCDRFDGRLAHGPLPAAGGKASQRAEHGGDRRLGQPVQLRHPRRPDGLRHLLVTAAKG